MEYFGWKTSVDSKACVLEVIENVADAFELSRGISRVTDFPDDALIRMDRNFPKQIKLADQLDNDSGLTIVSTKIADAIKALSLTDVELLPISILDHKGSDVDQHYFIVNPCTVLDCIDKEASSLMWNPLDENLIAGVLGLVLQEGFESDSMIFRPKHFPQRIMVREDFVKKIEAIDASGVRFVPIDELI